MSNETEWTCPACGERTVVRHYLQRGGVIVHDKDAAYAEAAGLVEPEPGRPDQNQASS